MASSSFSSMRSSRDALLKKLSEQAKTQDQKGGGADDRFWKLTTDAKTKIGSAVLRFLPPAKDEDLSWVRRFRHAFKVGGSWFIENCPTTIGRTCPVCKNNNELWNSGNEQDKNLARDRKRKLEHISNVYIINDPAKPENNGTVKLYTYGQKIFEKIKDKLEPEFADTAVINPFDFWDGATFKLRSRDQGGFVNYDKSEFDNPSPLLGGDEAKLEEIWNQQKPLAEFVDEKAFKSYEELEKKLNSVLTGGDKGPKTAEEAIKEEQKRALPTQEDAAEAAAALAQADEKKPASRARRTPAAKPKEAPAAEAPASDDDEDIKSFFAELGGDDE